MRAVAKEQKLVLTPLTSSLASGLKHLGEFSQSSSNTLLCPAQAVINKTHLVYCLCSTI